MLVRNTHTEARTGTPARTHTLRQYREHDLWRKGAEKTAVFKDLGQPVRKKTKHASGDPTVRGQGSVL